MSESVGKEYAEMLDGRWKTILSLKEKSFEIFLHHFLRKAKVCSIIIL